MSIHDDLEAVYANMLTIDGPDHEFVIERESLQLGRTFSREAFAVLQSEMIAWVGSRVMRRWDTTGEPPSRLTITVSVVAS